MTVLIVRTQTPTLHPLHSTSSPPKSLQREHHYEASDVGHLGQTLHTDEYSSGFVDGAMDGGSRASFGYSLVINRLRMIIAANSERTLRWLVFASNTSNALERTTSV